MDDLTKNTESYENQFTVGFNSDLEQFDLIISKQLIEILDLYKDKMLVFAKQYGNKEFTIAIGIADKNEVREYEDEEIEEDD